MRIKKLIGSMLISVFVLTNIVPLSVFANTTNSSEQESNQESTVEILPFLETNNASTTDATVNDTIVSDIFGNGVIEEENEGKVQQEEFPTLPQSPGKKTGIGKDKEKSPQDKG